MYQLKSDIDSDPVRIINRENNFIILDNGNKIHVLDFEKLFEGVDPTVRNVLERLENMNSEIHTDIPLDYVEPDTFLRKDDVILSDIANSIKKIDLKKCKFGKKYTINDELKHHNQYKVINNTIYENIFQDGNWSNEEYKQYYEKNEVSNDESI